VCMCVCVCMCECVCVVYVLCVYICASARVGGWVGVRVRVCACVRRYFYTTPADSQHTKEATKHTFGRDMGVQPFERMMRSASKKFRNRDDREGSFRKSLSNVACGRTSQAMASVIDVKIQNKVPCGVLRSFTGPFRIIFIFIIIIIIFVNCYYLLLLIVL
jgi:hypothetical protein